MSKSPAGRCGRLEDIHPAERDDADCDMHRSCPKELVKVANRTRSLKRMLLADLDLSPDAIQARSVTTLRRKNIEIEEPLRRRLLQFPA